jgi:alkylresorcinol/alkylpyrone synthase
MKKSESNGGKILAAVSVTPDYQYKTEDVIAAADDLWLKHIDPTVRKMALRLFHGAEIDARNSVEPLDVVFNDESFEEKNNRFIKASKYMGGKALKKALDQSQLKPTDIDMIITVSCTGFMIPSLDAYLINEFSMRQDIQRLPVTEMGCAAGISGLIYAHGFAKSNPQMRIAIVSVETPSLTFQKRDFAMENLVSTAIFADGASCVILGPSDEVKPKIVDTSMYHFPEGTHLMGYQLKNSGLKIVLDRDVPETIQAHFPKFFFPILERNGLSPESVTHYMFHPGGKKIINQVEDFIGRYGKDISISKNVLKQNGNMSSSTIFYILEKTIQKDTHAGDTGYMLAFGPGFSAQSLILRWE